MPTYGRPSHFYNSRPSHSYNSQWCEDCGMSGRALPGGCFIHLRPLDGGPDIALCTPCFEDVRRTGHSKAMRQLLGSRSACASSSPAPRASSSPAPVRPEPTKSSAKESQDSREFQLLYALARRLESIDHPWITALQPRRLVDSEFVRRAFAELMADSHAGVKFSSVAFLVLVLACTYWQLFSLYACLNIMSIILLPLTQAKMEAVLTRLHSYGGDLSFFCVLLATNGIYVPIACSRLPASVKFTASMLLEAVNSNFNSARVASILAAPNGRKAGARRFLLIEVILESVLIEIAPVSLLATLVLPWRGASGGVLLKRWRQLDPWDRSGTFGLLLLIPLLSDDRNTPGYPEGVPNGVIATMTVLRWLRAVWPYILQITFAVAAAIFACGCMSL